MGVHAYAVDVERRLMAGELTDMQARALLAEGLRAELERIIALQDAADLRADEEIDARIEALEEENKALRRLARRNEFGALEPWIADAARRVGTPAPSAIDPDLGRRDATPSRRRRRPTSSGATRLRIGAGRPARSSCAMRSIGCRCSF